MSTTTLHTTYAEATQPKLWVLVGDDEFEEFERSDWQAPEGMAGKLLMEEWDEDWEETEIPGSEYAVHLRERVQQASANLKNGK